MIQANELRIGNWIKFGKIRTVVAGVGTKFYTDPDGGQYPLDECNGIKLTEEILFKCGAVKVPHKVFTNRFELPIKRFKKIIITDIGTPNFMMGIAECNYLKGHVEDIVNIHNWDFEKDMYLHHFQNIYFALTGKELEVIL